MKLQIQQKQFKEILMKEKVICKAKNLYVSLCFLLITVALMIAVSIYCYLIKYRAKQKHLLPYHVKNNKFNKILYGQYKLE